MTHQISPDRLSLRDLVIIILFFSLWNPVKAMEQMDVPKPRDHGHARMGGLLRVENELSSGMFPRKRDRQQSHFLPFACKGVLSCSMIFSVLETLVSTITTICNDLGTHDYLVTCMSTLVCGSQTSTQCRNDISLLA